MGIISIVGVLIVWYFTVLPLTSKFRSDLLVWALLNGAAILILYKFLASHIEGAVR